MINVVSLSTGKSSMELVMALRKKLGDVRCVFMDTGDEDELSYDFLKKANKYFDLDCEVIRADFNQPLGVKHSYQVIDIIACKKDRYAMKGFMKKYGTPTFMSKQCTSRMKEEIHDMYCDNQFGREEFKGDEHAERLLKKHGTKTQLSDYKKLLRHGVPNYKTWIGIRFDEPKRLGGMEIYSSMIKLGFSKEDISNIYVEMKRSPNSFDFDSWFKWEPEHLEVYGKLCARVAIHLLNRLHYMAEVTNIEKQDVIQKWAVDAPVALTIDEHRGNCTFCPKKSKGKIALAARDLPEEAEEWREMIKEARQGNRKIDKTVMYAGNNTFDSIIAMFSSYSRDEIEKTLRMSKAMESSCSESCEAFGD